MASPPSSPRKQHARSLFAGLPRHYDRAGAALSFGQDPRWRAAARGRRSRWDLRTACSTSRPAPAWSRRRSCARTGCHVTALDQSADMLAGLRARLAADPAAGGADRAARGRGGAAAVRRRRVRRAHVHLPAALRRRPRRDAARARARRQARRDGRDGRVRRAARGACCARCGGSTRAPCMPLLGRLLSRDWQEVGAFLGPSIEGFYARVPVVAARRAVGGGGPGGGPRAADELRRRRRDDGGPRGVSDGLDRPAFYALPGGGWRDLVTLLHPPYTAWHLSLRRARRRGVVALRPRPPRRRARRVPARGRRRRARARRAARPPARHPPLRSHADRARGARARRRVRDRRRRCGHCLARR